LWEVKRVSEGDEGEGIWLMSFSGGLRFEASPGKQFCKTLSRKTLHINRLKVKALSSSPSTTKKKKR
jgi:hypothetical protein